MNELQYEILTDDSWFESRTVLKKTIIHLIDEWKSRLGIADWTLEVTFTKEVPLATCMVRENYYSAHLNFYLKRVEDELDTNFDLEELIVHEMSHITGWDVPIMCERLIQEMDLPTKELERQREKMEERMVTLFSRGLVMAKYGLTKVPDSFTTKLEEGWEELRAIGDGDKEYLRGQGITP